MSLMYKVCKRMIERSNYPEDMPERIDAFYYNGLITDNEYNILVSMIKVT